ncbi:hypothetical protein CGRA01v4_11064 [Colletotrichum graminicola]|nr:hypothetical protein CGRA01v4_11064 [Colletotrichum graminicola]
MAIQCIGRLGSTTSEAHVPCHGSSASLRSLLRLSISPSPFGSQTLSQAGPERSIFADYGPVAEEQRGHTGTPKKKKKKEGGICFEKKRASQKGKAPMLPQMTPKGPPRGKHWTGVVWRLVRRPSQSHLEEANHGTRFDCPTLPRYIDREGLNQGHQLRPWWTRKWDRLGPQSLPPGSCTSGGAQKLIRTRAERERVIQRQKGET